MSAPPSFHVQEHDHPGGCRLAVHGEVDLSTVPDLRIAARRAARRHAEVVLDLREVSFIDSSGIALLVGLDGDAHRDGFALSILAGDAVLRVIDLCALRDRLPLRDAL